MTEPMVMVILGSGTILFMLGGYRWKGWRRIVWPILVAVTVWMAGVPLQITILAGAVTAGVNSLPYGEKWKLPWEEEETPMPWPARVAVFGSYALPAVVLNSRMWPACLITAALLSGAFIWSRKWQPFTWKLWEGLAGFTQAATLIIAVLWSGI